MYEAGLHECVCVCLCVPAQQEGLCVPATLDGAIFTGTAENILTPVKIILLSDGYIHDTYRFSRLGLSANVSLLSTFTPVLP